MNRKQKIIYEIIFTILALITVIITIFDLLEKINLETNLTLYYIDATIFVIFVIDYFVRLFIAEDKKIFFKQNIPDLIAIIPFSSLFKVFRISKLFRLTKLTKTFRLFALGSRLNKKIIKILKTNGLDYTLYFAIIVILLGTLGIYYTEYGITIHNFQDAFWFSFVTTTTVGYGDITPQTSLGRIIAGFLMLTGIGTIGMLTASISTFFINTPKIIRKKANHNLIDKLVNECKYLDTENIKSVLDYVEYLKHKKNRG